jgi:hypothetical protein
MRVLLIEDDSATAQSIELMLKSESQCLHTTDLGEEVDLGKPTTMTSCSIPPDVRFEVQRSPGLQGRDLILILPASPGPKMAERPSLALTTT